MASSVKYTTVIVGQGITGLSCALSLKKRGVTDFIVLEDPTTPALSDEFTNFVMGSPIDNYTRFYHGHGHNTALNMFNFTRLGFHKVKEFCLEHSLKATFGQYLRLITHPMEHEESIKAVQKLQTDHFESKHLPKEGLWTNKNLLAIQSQGLLAGTAPGLIAYLKKMLSKHLVSTPIKNLSEDAKGVHLKTLEGKISCEVAILCSHLGIRSLIPQIAHYLVPVSDQIALAHARFPADLIGTYLTHKHGHHRLGFLEQNKIQLSGARYLRHHAGINQDSWDASLKISNHLLHIWQSLLGFIDNAHILEQKGGRSIIPQDELPLIGPMFNQSRLLIGTGYNSCGLSLGFQAGHSLAEILMTGQSHELPRIFWPDRFRQLT